MLGARERLARLSAWWPRDDRVARAPGRVRGAPGPARCGACRLADHPAGLAAGRRGAARRGSAADRRTRPARRRRARLRSAIDERANPAAAMPARWELARPLLWEGRLAELRGLLREIARLGGPTDRSAALREHWRLDSVVVADEEVAPDPRPGRADRARRSVCRTSSARTWRSSMDASTRRARGWIVVPGASVPIRGSIGPSRSPSCAGRWPPAGPTRHRVRWSRSGRTRSSPGSPGRSAPGSPGAAAMASPSAARSNSSSRSSPARRGRSTAWPSWRCGPARPIAPRRSAAAARRPCATGPATAA